MTSASKMSCAASPAGRMTCVTLVSRPKSQHRDTMQAITSAASGIALHTAAWQYGCVAGQAGAARAALEPTYGVAVVDTRGDGTCLDQALMGAAYAAGLAGLPFSGMPASSPHASLLFRGWMAAGLELAVPGAAQATLLGSWLVEKDYITASSLLSLKSALQHSHKDLSVEACIVFWAITGSAVGVVDALALEEGGALLPQVWVAGGPPSDVEAQPLLLVARSRNHFLVAFSAGTLTVRGVPLAQLGLPSNVEAHVAHGMVAYVLLPLGVNAGEMASLRRKYVGICALN